MSPRAAFLLILGSQLGPRVESLVRLSGDVRDFLANCRPPCGSSSVWGAREGCWNRFLGMLGAFPGGIWGILVNLCVASVIHCMSVLFQVRTKFVQILNRSLFCRWCLALVALPFSCRGGGRAERVE